MKKLSLICAVFFVLTANLHAQSFTGEQALQGYGVFGDQLTFIFDEALYGVTPKKVFVTGEFRNWDTSINSPEWNLKQTGQQWLLTIDNTDFAIVKPNTKFKFRTDNGDWMSPPSGAPNQKGGDLVFMKQDESLELKAEIKSDNLIWAEIGANRSFLPSDYVISDAQGNKIKVAKVLPNGAKTTLIVPESPLDKRRAYYLEIPSQNQKVICSYDGWFRELCSSKEMGANIDNGKTTIRVFSPRAEKVKLYLYKNKDDDKAYRIEEMKQDKDGVWESFFNEDLHGVYYDFTVHGSKDPGNLFYETRPVHVNDPYARVSDDTFGKCRIWHRTVPAKPLKNGIPTMENVIAYEVHVQDFTDKLPLPDSLKGTLKGMVASGLKNENGKKIGFDYLIELGINTVHLMPVQEYLHFPTDDWKASFENDPYMKEQGVSEENYQWGYRTSFAMAVESRYRTKGSELGSERNQFRDLVQAFHDKNIAVIIDIVPNHTAEDMDGQSWNFNFNGFDKQYYYRTKNFEHIGGYGNEIKTENRPMTQRWLIDQCLYFINEFGIDGFRIDLAGQIDQQTLLALREIVGKDKIIYGEPWIGSNDPNYENNPDWDWYKEDSPITYFQDEVRTAYKGPVFELKDPKNDRGWSGGKYSDRPNVMKGLTSSYKDDKTPNSGISYLDIHDNFALADQFGKDFDGRTDVYQDEYKIATTLLYTTVGPIVLHGGSEIMRSKAHAPLKEVVKETKLGYKTYMHGYRDTYNHREANDFKWDLVGQKPNKQNRNDYANMYAFWQGLGKLRNSDYGKVFRVADAVPEGYYTWILPKDESMLGYLVNEKVLVLINAGEKANSFDSVKLPAGKWKLVGTTKEVNLKGVKSSNKTTKIKSGLNKVDMEPTSLYIWVKD
ncbi:MAG: hypothetical protein KBA02_03195 [Paludibacteraceae bacterium]|jgi:pullulanase|nr:hypothetical protein [Paludibacteraceae bacterium]